MRSFEQLEPRWLLSNWSGHITQDTVWDDPNDTYTVTGDLWVDPGVTLTVAQSVRVYLNAGVDLTVDGSMEINDAEWVNIYDRYNQSGIQVYGSLTVSNTLFQDVWSGSDNRSTYIECLHWWHLHGQRVGYPLGLALVR